MSKPLDNDNEIKLWLPAFDAVKEGKQPICHRCGSDEIGVLKEAAEDGVGFMLITCNSCGKSGWFSRVQF